MGNARTIEVTCPTCGGRAPYVPSNPHRPFCCERCRDIDLGAWASERYRVADPDRPTDDEATPRTD
jgi:hypothetical protein